MNTNTRGKQTVVGWAMGILVWINVLTILISTYNFGYVDWETVAKMSAIALPPLAVGAILLYRFRTVPVAERQTERPMRQHLAGAGR